MKFSFNDLGKKVFILLCDNPSVVIIDVAVLPVPNPWYTNNPVYGVFGWIILLNKAWCSREKPLNV